VAEDESGRIAILGGTGDQGLGLAFRFVAAGRSVWIGSRRLDRAKTAAEQVRERLPQGNVEGLENAAAVRAAGGGIVIVSVPFEHVASTMKAVRAELAPPALVVSMAVPLATAIGDVAGRVLTVSQGSCAELTQSLVPDGVQVVSAFQNVSAHRLLDLDHPVDCDVIVSGKKGARQRVMALCADIPGSRAVDGGPLYNARYVEELTALLIGLNIRYRVPEGVGIRISHLP
jgi:NADPH-dependent F420 reductase